jgi:hypothetical protein
MANVPLTIAPGVISDDTTFLAKGAWSDVDKVRFWRGQPQTIGGWESFIGELLGGVCRTVFGWTDNASTMNVAFGTHQTLEVSVGGGLYDITPATSSTAEGTITLSTTTAPAIDQTFVVSGQTFTFKTTRSATGQVTIGADATARAANIVTALNTDIGSEVTASSSTNVVTVVADVAGFAGNLAFRNGNSTGLTFSGYGYLSGGSTFTPGLINGTGGLGYGTGAYSTGAWSEPSTGDFWPQTWSLAAYGESLMANPRGQTIFWWQNNITSPAEALANAPANVTYMLTTQTRQVMAFGCNEELSGDFNALCIRFTDVEDPTDWQTRSSNLAGEVILEGGGRIVAARQIANYLYVWTDAALYLGQFTGNVAQPWKFDRQGDHCGLIGPNAAVIVGQRAFWIAPNRQFYGCGLGGEPRQLSSPLQADFAAHLSDSQADKIVATSVTEFGEVWWFYPDDREGVENSRYVSLTDDGFWSKGMLPRTAFVDASPAVSPIGVTYEGQVYYHERGASADGNAISGFIESADQYISEADSLVMVRGVWPDFSQQEGPLSMTVATRLYPQSTRREKGPFAMPKGKKRKDFLLQGRLLNVRIDFNSSPAFFRLGKIEVDVVETGRR